MQRSQSIFLTLSLLAGCATSAQPTPTTGTPPDVAPAAEPVIEVSMHAEALLQAEHRQRILRDSDSLRSGDGMALYVKVDRPAYTYVALVNRDGTTSVLYPTGGDTVMPSGIEQRIPQAGQWLYLDDKTGQEHLYVIASTRPLHKTDRGLCSQLRLPCGPVIAGNPPPPPPPPGNLDTRTRGRKHKTGPILQAETDEGGVAVLHFRFRHE